MNTDELYRYLNSSDKIENKKKELKAYFLAQIESFLAHPGDGQKIANEIAGLLSTKTALSMKDEDPYLEIMDVAGQLELPIAQRQGGSNWQSLIEKVHELD